MLNRVEFRWLEKKLVQQKIEFCLLIALDQENTAHLEDEEHPGDAETDQGAQDEAGHPHQAELQDCHYEGRWVSKGFEAYDGSTLKHFNFEKL